MLHCPGVTGPYNPCPSLMTGLTHSEAQFFGTIFIVLVAIGLVALAALLLVIAMTSIRD